METIKVVEMVRQIRDDDYTATKNMNHEELMRYFSKKAKLVNDEAAKGYTKAQSSSDMEHVSQSKVLVP
jgi:hypothetical protein